MSRNHYNLNELTEYELQEKLCKNCGTKFYKAWSKWTLSEFCCKSCSKKYAANVNKNEVRKKVSASLKKYHEQLTEGVYKKMRQMLASKKRNKLKEDYLKNPKICPICNNIIPYERKHCKTCSKECGRKAIVKTKLDKGYYDDPNRHFVTSKCGYYKGIYCGSTYELVYTIYNLDHNIPFERNKKGFPYEYKGKTHHYYPDYITPDGYVEIKGMWTDKVDAKIAAVDEPIKILYKKDLKYAFDYVSEIYLNGKKTGFQVLYDNHKPKYEKICPECGITFYRDVNDRKFCSHSCAVKYNSKNRKNAIKKINRTPNNELQIPEGFVQIPSLEGYFINKEKKVWSAWFGGRYIKLHKQKGIYEKYLLSKNGKLKWYTPDELFNMTFNK